MSSVLLCCHPQYPWSLFCCVVTIIPMIIVLSCGHHHTHDHCSVMWSPSVPMIIVLSCGHPQYPWSLFCIVAGFAAADLLFGFRPGVSWTSSLTRPHHNFCTCWCTEALLQCPLCPWYGTVLSFFLVCSCLLPSPFCLSFFLSFLLAPLSPPSLLPSPSCMSFFFSFLPPSPPLFSFSPLPSAHLNFDTYFNKGKGSCVQFHVR